MSLHQGLSQGKCKARVTIHTTFRAAAAAAAAGVCTTEGVRKLGAKRARELVERGVLVLGSLS